MDFYGYMRPNGKAGARNYVLLLPVNRSLNFIASNVERMTRTLVILRFLLKPDAQKLTVKLLHAH